MKKEIINIEELKTDITTLLSAATLSEEERKWFAKVYIREVLQKGHYRPAGSHPDRKLSTQPIIYDPAQEFVHNTVHILEWLAELSQRDPRLHSKLSRITFQQAREHSSRWHAAMARAAEKSDRYVEPDEENAPKVLDLGDGWEVFWLKTDVARDIEGEIMGHCVGSGTYDDLASDEGVFSVRKDNIAHLTLHLSGPDLKQAVTKGNGDIPERYQWLVDEAQKRLTARLLLNIDRVVGADIPDGAHEAAGGVIIHTTDGLLHREDGPAYIHKGDLQWWVGGQRHREDGPAVIWSDGIEEWWLDGKCHREDGPAVLFPNGEEKWFRNGVVHRDGGPAMVLSDGSRFWYFDGEPHREDGPAIERADGRQEWWMNGERHREDGPAVIYPDGDQEWWQNGKFHREDGPAAVWAGGKHLEWWLDGERHRVDGPARITASGDRYWYQNNLLHREDGPAIDITDGTKEWFRHGKQHREDGPAHIYNDGSEYWYRDGNLHREDGPAVRHYDGSEEWWLDGEQKTFEEHQSMTEPKGVRLVGA